MRREAEKPTNRIFRRTDGGGDGDLGEDRPSGLLLDEVEYGLGRIDGRPTTDADDDVRAGVLERFDTVSDPGDGRMLADLVKRRAVGVVLFKDALHCLHDIGLQNTR